MKAFLLAGGHGTRLRPLTDSVPKCLLPVRGVPLLDIWLDSCARSGISEVLINLHAHAEAIERHLKEFRPPVEVRLVREERLLGSAGTIAANRDWVEKEDTFNIFYSDVLTDADLTGLNEFHLEHSLVATIGLYRVPDPSRCGVARMDGSGVITDFEEKPTTPRSNLVFSGLMTAGRGLLDHIPAAVPADIGFHVLPRIVGKMRGYPISEFLLDIGTLENYAQAQATWPYDSRRAKTNLECAATDRQSSVASRTRRKTRAAGRAR